MGDFGFYIMLGLEHVLDLEAYDHILFLAALTIPFTFVDWKKVLVLATVFTIAHCFSLGLSVYEVVVVDVSLIEFLIPVTIFFTGIYNLIGSRKTTDQKNMAAYLTATGFFGLVHGFGFSNYFKMLMAGEEEKISPLLGFAAGIEISQILILLAVLSGNYIVRSLFKVKQPSFIQIMSIIVLFITIPMLITTFPW
ncbi:HupE/UreJ family protein [Arenibacter sp. F26102]|uniref:HupE/UreJ family protein n=1 Tax=Arenibacter sp. F26102 TaxID=2926416 RepID=UPI001FF2A28F|nr:HupE/UreJ family protein [Arenibacter sp. F26102]MCK0144247.1 HupE/UreJ family protein [Arenibacter sp. F26102]